MTLNALQLLIAAAVTDTNLRDRLLNGERQQVLELFDVSPEERAFLMQVNARTIQEFALKLEAWLEEG